MGLIFIGMRLLLSFLGLVILTGCATTAYVETPCPPPSGVIIVPAPSPYYYYGPPPVYPYGGWYGHRYGHGHIHH